MLGMKTTRFDERDAQGVEELRKQLLAVVRQARPDALDKIAAALESAGFLEQRTVPANAEERELAQHCEKFADNCCRSKRRPPSASRRPGLAGRSAWTLLCTKSKTPPAPPSAP